MKNGNNTTVVFYKGIIECSINVKDQIYKLNLHNRGLDYLKYAFAKALHNNEEFEACDTPGYVAIYKLPQSGDEEKFTIEDISISGRLLVDENSDGFPLAVTFTAYISYDDLQEGVDALSSDVFKIYLLSHDDMNSEVRRHRMTEFKIQPSVLAYITPGVTATLNWTMRLMNSENEE